MRLKQYEPMKCDLNRADDLEVDQFGDCASPGVLPRARVLALDVDMM